MLPHQFESYPLAMAELTATLSAGRLPVMPTGVLKFPFFEALPWIGLALSFVASVYCWRRIWTSNDHRFYKGMATLIAALPFIGPLLYAYMEFPAAHPNAPLLRRQAQPGSRLLRYWNAHEHIYLSWAALIFVALGGLAWWLHGWQPGNIYETLIGAVATDVGNTHIWLLVFAVLVYAYIDRRKKFYKRMIAAQAEEDARKGLPARDGHRAVHH